MWQRCNDPKHPQYENYKDCPIDDRYHCLSNYINDIKTLDNFDLLKENPSKYDIDKDKIDPNNRCYYYEHLTITTDSDNSKERIKRRGTPTNPKPIIGINIDSNSIVIFKSVRDADDMGFDHSNISKCCNKPNRTHGGYKWFYLDMNDRVIKND